MAKLAKKELPPPQKTKQGCLGLVIMMIAVSVLVSMCSSNDNDASQGPTKTTDNAVSNTTENVAQSTAAASVAKVEPVKAEEPKKVEELKQVNANLGMTPQELGGKIDKILKLNTQLGKI